MSLKPREALATSVGASAFDGDGYLSVNGLVGSEVVGVTVHADGTDVRATVKSAASWPGGRRSPSATRARRSRASGLSLTFVDGTTVDLTAEQSAPLSGHGSSRG